MLVNSEMIYPIWTIEPTHKLIEQAIMFPYIVLSQKELYYILCVILLKNEFMRRLYSYLKNTLTIEGKGKF
jgi:hypothetical protein